MPFYFFGGRVGYRWKCCAMGASGDFTYEKWGGGYIMSGRKWGRSDLVAKGCKIRNLPPPLFVFMAPAFLPFLKTKKNTNFKMELHFTLMSILQYGQYNVKYSNRHNVNQWETDCSYAGQSTNHIVIWNINENYYKYNFQCPFWGIYNRNRRNSASLINLY